MIAKEAHTKSLWNKISDNVKRAINKSVESGLCYCYGYLSVDKDLLNNVVKDKNTLEELGYFVNVSEIKLTHDTDFKFNITW